MDTWLKKFQHLKIQLEEIKSATDNFNDKTNCIGGGGFGKVYKGEMSHSKGRSMVAIKRLDPKHGQGIPEFLKEIMTLSRYNHENIISLLGFCYQGDEMILVYEHASRGSLDRHLSSPHLTWSQRIQICLDTAKGLSYLHDPRETHQRLIHCDIKSANILLDEQWNVKVSDFGLSIMGSANEQQSVVITAAVGTHGYCDPQYAMTNSLTKESDVYSFGVVLFEVLCGRLCCTYRNNRVEKNFVPNWIKSYEQKKLNDIIFKSLTIKPLDQNSLETLSNIAYRCLKEFREDRPKMAEVVTELEFALERQELTEGKLSRFFYQEIAKTAVPPLYYTSEAELKQLMRKGILLNGGKTWFSVNMKGEHCEMISFAECVDSDPSKTESNSFLSRFKSRFQASKTKSNVRSYDSRFAMGTYPYEGGKFKTRVKSQFLSPLTIYTVNLVFKFSFPARKWQLIYLKYRLQGENITSVSYLAYQREDGWWACELYQFTSDSRFVDLEILFDGSDNCYDLIEVEGIEFRPLEKVELRYEKQPISVSDSDADWEEKLPTDYEDIMKWSVHNVKWTTKKEAYSIIRKGFVIDDGEKLFFLDKNGKKCHMLSAANIRSWNKDELHLSESRFREAVLLSSKFTIELNIQFHLVSSQTTYATYLVYKFPENKSRFKGPVEVIEMFGSDYHWYIYLVSPQTPVIRPPKPDQNTYNLVSRPNIKGLPQQRNDGWMEVQIWEFQTTTNTKMIRMCLQLTPCDDTTFKGLRIQGVEFRPI